MPRVVFSALVLVAVATTVNGQQGKQDKPIKNNSHYSDEWLAGLPYGGPLVAAAGYYPSATDRRNGSGQGEFRGFDEDRNEVMIWKYRAIAATRYKIERGAIYFRDGQIIRPADLKRPEKIRVYYDRKTNKALAIGVGELPADPLAYAQKSANENHDAGTLVSMGETTLNQVGYMPAIVKVFQVLDEENMLIHVTACVRDGVLRRHDQILWVKGYPTKAFAHDSTFKPDGKFKVTRAVDYRNKAGDPQRVFQVEPVARNQKE